MGIFTRGGCLQGWAGKVLAGEEAMLRKRFGLVLVPGVGEASRGSCQGAFERLGVCCQTGKVPVSQITPGGISGSFTPLLLKKKKFIDTQKSLIPHTSITSCLYLLGS